MQRVLRRLRELPAREEATSDVEYVLILALVVLPLCVVIPAVLIEGNAEFFRRIDLVTSFPYP